MRELRWTEAEKKLSRRAFEVALQAELADVLQDFKARAAAVQRPCSRCVLAIGGVRALSYGE